MISKLPRWVWGGGFVLAFIAGMINAVGLVGFQHQGITHLTGNTSLLAVAAVHEDTAQILHLLTVIGSFVAGAVLSGFIIQDTALQLGRRYGVALLLESCLLFVSVRFLHQQNVAGDYLASCACGLQNAMVSTYSGAVLRTTHVSGLFTDVGIFLGHCLRGLKVDWRRFRLWGTIITGFFTGGIAGAWAFGHWNYSTLYLPALLTGGSGLGYAWYRHQRRHRAETHS